MTVHLTHWGTFEAVSDGERLTEVRPWRGDPEPMPLIDNVVDAHRHPARIDQPYVSGPAGWTDGPAPTEARGRDEFVPVDWESALDLVADELRRVHGEHRPVGDLRRLLRLGQRGPVPPRAEPTQAVPRARRWFHQFGQQLLPTALTEPSSCRTFSSPNAESLLPPQLAGDRRAHRTVGGLRMMPRKNTAVASGGNAHHDMVAGGCGAPGRVVAGFVTVGPLADDMPGGGPRPTG